MPNETVAFDPGFAPFVEHFSMNIMTVNQILQSQPSFNQKKFRYKMLEKQIIALIENSVAFYYGCLLWAFYLKNKYKDEPRELSGNTFKDLTEEQLKEYDFFEEIDYVIAYLDVYKRDVKYYTGKKAIVPEKWANILALYREFLELNNGFLKVSNTADIVLPQALLRLDFDESINTEIQKAISNKQIEALLSVDFIK